MRLGVIADDVTGASDLADAVCDEGWSAVVFFGVPDGPLPECDCAVVALKSRTAPVDQAVGESALAARALLSSGAELLYQKYCSTFDSTDRGNIGPVADALRDLAGAAVTVGTPATPRSGRTQYLGHLFVGRQLLAESPLRDHPLTPMRDSDLVRVLGRQTPTPVGLIDRSTVAAGPDAVATAIANGAGHLLVDALDDTDLDVLAAAVHRLGGRPAIVTGGAAGFAAALARTTGATGRVRSSAEAVPAGTAPRLLLSGSCSARTREQVAAFAGPVFRLDPFALAADPDATVARLLAEVAAGFAAGSAPVLVASTAEPDAVAAADDRLGPGTAAELLERAAGAIAAHAVRELGVRRLLVAGGETSGSVVRALRLRALRVGAAAAPGVPWMVPVGDDSLAVLLKSGNFGDVDLFNTAWKACP
jgi:uncharacterized protein YgbK (DUF1537 family)